MIHESQLIISTPNARPFGGQHVGVQLPAVTIEHTPSGNTITIKGARSNSGAKRVALEALEFALLSLNWHQSDLDRDISK